MRLWQSGEMRSANSEWQANSPESGFAGIARSPATSATERLGAAEILCFAQESRAWSKQLGHPLPVPHSRTDDL
jgi:hypothetical protein